MANLGEVQYRFKRNKTKAFADFKAKLKEKYDKPGMIFSVSDIDDPDYLTFFYAKKWNFAEEFESSVFQKKRYMGLYNVISDQVSASGVFDAYGGEEFCRGAAEIVSGTRFDGNLVIGVDDEEVELEVKGYDSEVSKFFQTQYGIKLPSGIDYFVYTTSDEIRNGFWDENESLNNLPGNIKKIPLNTIESADRDDDEEDPLTKHFRSAVAGLLPELKVYLAPPVYKSVCAELMAAGLGGEAEGLTETNIQAIRIAYDKLCHASGYENIKQKLCDLQKEILSGRLRDKDLLVSPAR